LNFLEVVRMVGADIGRESIEIAGGIVANTFHQIASLQNVYFDLLRKSQSESDIMEWLTKLVPGYAPDGAPILSVLAKKTFQFSNGKTAWEDEETPIPFFEKDEFWGKGDPQFDAVKYESEIVPYKTMTDVALIGKAHAPKGAKVPWLDIGVQVGEARKISRIFGNRKVKVVGNGHLFTDPEPFSTMPLDFSRAYGGRDEKSEEGMTYVYPKNPVGKGFIVQNNPIALNQLELPNIEDPNALLSPKNLVLGKFANWKFYPKPAAFGFINKNSHPRFTMAGLSLDQRAGAEAERQKNLSEMPEIGTPGSQQPASPTPMMNLEFFNGAPEGLKFPFLTGSEIVRLAHMDPETPQFSFKLPGVRPVGWLDVGRFPEKFEMVLHGVTIHKESNQVTMLWRGCMHYDGPESLRTFTMLQFGAD
jgi:hypothetical protein